jgi:hypothetical protein
MRIELAVETFHEFPAYIPGVFLGNRSKHDVTHGNPSTPLRSLERGISTYGCFSCYLNGMFNLCQTYLLRERYTVRR